MSIYNRKSKIISWLLLFLNIIIINEVNTGFFQSKKMEIDLVEMLKEKIIHDNLKDTNECLVSEKEAINILKEKYNLNPAYIDIDENLRFILGKCNPIIYAPALYASRLVATFNCPVFKKDFLSFVKMRLFCGNDICKDETNTYEEHVLFPAAFSSPFKLTVSGETNKYTGCLGYFFKFYNTRTECPEEICEYSDGVRISFYGATPKTKSESKCGVKALEDLIYGGDLLPSFIANKLTSANIYKMVEKYRKMGYKEGFSVAGLSYDYRRYVFSNKYFINAFEYEVNRLYRNTGKPVIIITQSFGSLNVLNQLINLSPEMKSKIKCFVPIGPPFAGASKLLTAYLFGLDDFDSEIKIGDIELLKIEMNYFGEALAYSSSPVVAELRPQYGLTEALEKPEYSELKVALNELFDVEKECGNKNCPEEKIKDLTKNFRELFGDDFPTLSDEDCQLDPDEIYDDDSEQLNPSTTFHRKCRSEAYDYYNCPSLLYENDFGTQNMTALKIKELCGVYNSSLLYNIKSNEKKTPLDTVYAWNAKYPYNMSEMTELFNRYNKNFAEKYNKTLTIDDFETNEEFQKNGPLNVEYLKKNGNLSDLPIPEVDTYLIYGSFMATTSSLIYDKYNKTKRDFEINEVLFRGGDGTVPAFSSFLTGMKWLYEKKKFNLPQEIKIIEYCSPIGKSGNKYAYNSTTFKNKTFVAVSCDCINDDNKSYDPDKISNCQHSGMPGDSYLIDMIAKEILFDENNLNDFNENKKKAIKQYNKTFNYEQTCNDALFYLFQEDMDQVSQ